MKKLLRVLLLLALSPALHAETPVFMGAPGIAPGKKKELERKARAGDGASAYQLYNELTIDRDQKAAVDADPWLLLAVKLKNDEAERLLSMNIRSGSHAFKTWGDSQPKAVENLLQESAKTYGLSCDDLGNDYVEGYFGSENFAKAREYYLRGARQFNIEFCFRPLAKLYAEGQGGPQDDRAAYYWSSLDALCVDPGSMSGEEIWALRNKVAARLPLATVCEEWDKIDSYQAKIDFGAVKVYPAPFMADYAESIVSKKSAKDAAEKERQHRAALIQRG